jgi:hypothetical protein
MTSSDAWTVIVEVPEPGSFEELTTVTTPVVALIAKAPPVVSATIE